MKLDAAAVTALEELLSRTAAAYDLSQQRQAPDEDLRTFRQNLGQLHLKLGSHYLAAGEKKAALWHGARAHAFLPRHRDAAVLLVQAQLADGQSREAARVLADAAAVHTVDVGIQHLVGKVLLTDGRVAEAIAACRRACDLRPDDPILLGALGDALAVDAQMAEALSMYRRAIQLAPANAALLARYAGLCSDAGALDDARDAYETLITLQPRRGAHHRMLGLLKAYSRDDPHIARMEDLLRDCEPDSDNRREFDFALFRAYEATGDHDRAFRHLKSANDRLKVRLAHDPDATDRLFAGIEAAFPRGWRAPVTPDRDESPIFVVGMPRSGSTLCEQILASHPDVFAAGETPAFAAIVERHFLKPDLRFDLDALADMDRVRAFGDDYLAAIRASAAGGRRTVDKYLTNFLSVGFIRVIFPKARIVHCHRDPLANCFAIYASYFETNGLRFKADMEHTASYYVRYHRLMQHWREMFGAAILDLSYERLTEDQEGETRRLLAHCGLEWQPSCLEFHLKERAVKTASFAQVRRPLYSGADRRTGHYLAHLEPMLRVLSKAGLHPFRAAA